MGLGSNLWSVGKDAPVSWSDCKDGIGCLHIWLVEAREAFMSTCWFVIGIYVLLIIIFVFEILDTFTVSAVL